MNKQTYFQEYWKKKKDARNDARRQRYKKDSEYRSKAQRRARDYWRKNKGGTCPVDQTIVIAADGVRYGTVGHVAALINRSAFTVREYCRRGVIPVVTFYGRHGAKLFSPAQMALMVEVFDAFDAGELKNLQQVTIVLKKDWKDGEEEKQKRN